MTWDDQPAVAALTGPAPLDSSAATPTERPYGVRRAVLTVGMAAALLVTGGVAIVAAASPDPSASAAPTTTTPQSGGTTAPSDGTRHTGQPCPNDGSGSGGSSGSRGQSAQPTPSTTTPAT
jgi:hypothetical protein